MQETTKLACGCGQTCIVVQGAPIASVECCCTSCRTMAEKIQRLEGAPQILTDYAATPYVMYRKDRIKFVSGADTLKELLMTPDAKTRRVVATCCNTPMFLEFSHGHWLSIFAGLWPDEARPLLEMRTMASDLPADITLPDDVPNAKKQSFGFFTKLLGAWIAMGLRIPKIPETGKMDVS